MTHVTQGPLAPAEEQVIRDAAHTILKKTGTVNPEAVLILDVLDRKVSAAKAHGNGASAAADAAAAGTGKGLGVPKTYQVRKVANTKAPLEYRDLNQPPFSVPEGFYDSFAEVVAANSGEYFEDIFGKYHGPAKKEFRARVLLRFWREKGLVKNEKGRYVVTTDSVEFKKKAGKAWKALDTD